MRILGIDPGTAITGYGLIESKGYDLNPVAYGILDTQAGLPSSERLKQIYEQMAQLLEEAQADLVAVEQLFFNKNVRTALSVGEARGVILLAIADKGIPVVEYTPPQVKMAVTGYGKADKRQVQLMVRSILGLKKIPSPDDAADALAVAVCAAHSYSLEQRLSKEK